MGKDPAEWSNTEFAVEVGDEANSAGCETAAAAHGNDEYGLAAWYKL